MSAVASPVRSSNTSEEFTLTKSAYDDICKTVRVESGIELSENKMGLVKSRLQKRLRQLGLRDFAQYVSMLRADKSGDELAELVSAISTNVTKFNREPHHFDHLKEVTLPPLIERLKQGDEVRIWSAGCSNGSEPYTIACLALDLFPGIANTKFRILGTDIDKHTLNVARTGVYDRDMVSSLPQEVLGKHFKADGSQFRVSERVKSLVVYKPLNLMSQWPMRKTYDAVFCRNVLIYFTAETQERLFERFNERMKLNAFLYVGHSERISGRSEKCFQSVGSTTFKKISEFKP